MLKARLNYQPGWDNYDLWITEKRHNEVLFLQLETLRSSIAGENAKPFIQCDNPTFFAKDFAQAVLDAAWEIGLRPTGFKDIQNETTAIKEHLRDMRRLVFTAHTPYNLREID